MVLLAHELGMGYAALRKISKQSAVNEGKITVDELDSWREKHTDTDCAKNFSGSSKAMEQEAARRMWTRSVSRHQLCYTEMLSDGDSSAFKERIKVRPPKATHDMLPITSPESIPTTTSTTHSTSIHTTTSTTSTLSFS
ncbi:unnamed protein product, partial [Gadus morhua 'NCC']